MLVGRASEADATGTAPGDIVCLAPLYRRTIKVALLDTRELRMMGDAGPRPPSLDHYLEAQRIAFGPLMFQAVMSLVNGNAFGQPGSSSSLSPCGVQSSVQTSV